VVFGGDPGGALAAPAATLKADGEGRHLGLASTLYEDELDDRDDHARQRRLAWSSLMKRAYRVDVLIARAAPVLSENSIDAKAALRLFGSSVERSVVDDYDRVRARREPSCVRRHSRVLRTQLRHR
jgi:hypothetical protein